MSNVKTAFCRNYTNEHKFAADRVYFSGEIVQRLGRIGIVEGERQAQIGDEVGICFDRQVDVEKANPSLAIAAEATVGYIDSIDAGSTGTPMKAVAGGAGTFDIGIAVEESPAGSKFVRVIFPYGA